MLFYTDGLNEAQNRFKEEFNEDRLKEAVNKYTSNPAEVILNRIRDDILRFIDDAPQHDDMTAVLIKVH